MRSSIAFGISAIALGSLMQLCPAPPVVIAAAITAGGAVIGGAISTAGKMAMVVREEDLPPGVPKQEYHQCVKELKSAHVVVHGPVKDHGIRANGVPPTCMTLATVLVGDPVKGPWPTPCGSACLLYNHLTDKEYNRLAHIFNAHNG